MADSSELTPTKYTFWGRFQNPWKTWHDTRLRAGMVLTFTSGDPDCSPSPDDPRLLVDLPVHPPTFGPATQDGGVRLTWLGHASVLFNIDGVNVLCDPVFSDRCSASQHIGPRRYRPVPCQVAFLPIFSIILI